MIAKPTKSKHRCFINDSCVIAVWFAMLPEVLRYMRRNLRGLSYVELRKKTGGD